MRKGIFAAVLSAGLAAAALFSGTAYADGQKVVTLGADLTEEQKAAVLKYFGVYGQNIETLYITNQDERNHLGSYVPLEQIGTRTFSCALVNPTTSGGIRVKTANLSWVTSNMIATTLSTSGVVNCEVLAASPFEVSGTGALTGIIMAYESASGQTLQAEKKDIATQELITTGQIANQIGQEQATSLVNEIKIQVIENQVKTEPEIVNIVNNVVNQQVQISQGLSAEDYDLLLDLAERISEQDYDYEEMKETLQRVEDNVTNLDDEMKKMQQDDAAQSLMIEDEDEFDEDEDTEAVEASAYASDLLPEDSILMQTDDTALGENVIMDATDEEALANAEEAPAAPEPAPADQIVIPDASDVTVVENDTAEPAPADTAENAEDDFWNNAGTDDGWEVFNPEGEDTADQGQPADVQNVEAQDAEGQNAEDQNVEGQNAEDQNAEGQNQPDDWNVFEQNGEGDFWNNGDQNNEGDFWNSGDQNTEDDFWNEGGQDVEGTDDFTDEQNIDENINDGNVGNEGQDSGDESFNEGGAEDEGDAGDEGGAEDEGNAEGEPAPDEGSEDEGGAGAVEISGVEMTIADAYENDAAGSRIITVYADCDGNDVDFKEGTITITDASGEQTTFDLEDVPMAGIASMSDSELSSRGWQQGTAFNFVLDDYLETDNTYDIVFSGKLAKLDPETGEFVDGTEADVDKHISVQTGSYGVDLMSDDNYDPTAGSSITAELIFPEEAASAQISIADGNIASADSETVDLASGETTFDLQLNNRGTTDFTVEFYDAEGNLLTSHTAFVVVM